MCRSLLNFFRELNFPGVLCVKSYHSCYCCYYSLMNTAGTQTNKLLHVQRSFKSVLLFNSLTSDSVGKIKRCPLLFAQIAARCSQRHEAPKAWILTLASRMNKLCYQHNCATKSTSYLTQLSFSKQLCNVAFKFHQDECFVTTFQAFDILLTSKNVKINHCFSQ